MFGSSEKEKARAYVQSRGHESVTVAGLTPEEIAKLDAAMTVGTCWVRKGEDGQLQFSEAHLPAPDPIEDERMRPFWQPFISGKGSIQIEMFDEQRMKASCLPKITVEYVGAGDREPKSYERNASKLRSYGFECMRSQREEGSGRYIEQWILFTSYHAKGPLKEAMEAKKSTNEQVDAAVAFLCQHVHFGSLDVCVQRAALVFD
ncbi:hypothetical protein EPO34_01910 [Patescibacteria group bacterium]|nr:MAG: hypothetical protein EPO34_01910 [Patescibacteria group bacterium]